MEGTVHVEGKENKDKVEFRLDVVDTVPSDKSMSV